MDKQQRLDTLKAEMIANNVTPNLALQAKQLVMGDGDLNAKLFFVGEAPGAKEDEIGKPFQGAAGQLLNKLFDSAGLLRDDVYITNIVKYRPPENRNPTKAEKDDSWPYLKEELAIIQPSTILTLGNQSLGHFLPGATIGKVHGQLHPVIVDGVEYQLAPLYHPTSTVYSKLARQAFFDDLPTVLDQLK